MAADPSTLEGLDPFDLMDGEAARIDEYVAGLSGAEWEAPTACEGWDRRALLAHLAGSEEYNRACMTDSLPALFTSFGERGVTDMDSFNAVGVTERADREPPELIDEWRSECAETRRWLREHRGGEMATAVGLYPVDWQAFHLANELAIHADDLGVPVATADAGPRTEWLARAARFFVSETDKGVSIEPGDGGYVVGAGGKTAVLSDAELVAAVNGRLPDGSALDPELRAALSFMG
jgi:uncharacterized protein (TIGR03083 family)